MADRVKFADRLGIAGVQSMGHDAAARTGLVSPADPRSWLSRNCRAQGNLQRMNCTKVLLANQAAVFILTAAVLFATGAFATAQEVQHLTITQPGGMPGLPVITGIERGTNGLSVTWDGPSGYYQLFQKLGLRDPNWQPAGGLNASRKATITTLSSNAFFRVLGPAPQYAGAAVCLECHETIHNLQSDTRHVGAFTNAEFVAQGGQTNTACLACHTVGYRLPTGFISIADSRSTNQLAGMQCENCHGPAANHAANPDDPVARPRVELAATVCGGCHIRMEHPAYTEWLTSGHAKVTEPDMNPDSCGRCHIGPARVAMLKGKVVPQNDHSVAVTCGVCHDPHANRIWANVLNGVHMNDAGGFTVVITNTLLGPSYTNQLRNPLASTNDYFLTTSDVFSDKYDPDINVCAQCHNHRGAVWTSSSRPPHHSPQYNILLGTVGELAGGNAATNSSPGTHHLAEKQCVTCHMQTAEHQDGPPEIAAVTGHKFTMDSYEACAKCHGTAANAETLRNLILTPAITNLVNSVKGNLDNWATNMAPASLRVKYGPRAWEYTNPGELSPGGSGPNSTEQALIPDNIKIARFNLYLVVNDGSLGVHNPHHCLELLNYANNRVRQELND